jgi:hypothetical protein
MMHRTTSCRGLKTEVPKGVAQQPCAHDRVGAQLLVVVAGRCPMNDRCGINDGECSARGATGDYVTSAAGASTCCSSGTSGSGTSFIAASAALIAP